MKTHEKRAIERAIPVAKKRIDMQIEDNFFDMFSNETYKQLVAHEATRVAQLRAHRIYSNETYKELLEYAYFLIEGGRND